VSGQYLVFMCVQVRMRLGDRSSCPRSARPRALCDLLRSLGLLDGETVHGSLVPESLPGPVGERLATFAAANWPSPWREALAVALAGGTVFGTPIVHYKPRRLTRGRAALAGDAAHAASPMVGGGFRGGLYDVATLAPRSWPG
jgi:2-polyprenyl-6-methoxyphenol hydroxylase-like FAD-dependent oxidoreductase